MMNIANGGKRKGNTEYKEGKGDSRRFTDVIRRM